jgi:hypothetical protein
MLARVRELSGGKTVRVGVLADKAKTAERGKHSKKARVRAKVERRARAAPSLLEVAIIHEFGGGRVPARSFIRATMDERRTEIVALQVHLAQQVLKGAMTPDQALNALGAKVAGWCQTRITTGIAPPLAASTIKRKNAATKRKGNKGIPLVMTGQLRSSITHAVEG